jgi:hypothetical protein
LSSDIFKTLPVGSILPQVTSSVPLNQLCSVAPETQQ